MLEILIVVLLVYVSYKLSKQEALMREQNELIEDLRDVQDECRNHVERLENMHDIASDKQNLGYNFTWAKKVKKIQK